MRDISLGKLSDTYSESSRASPSSTDWALDTHLKTPKYTILVYWQWLIYLIYRN